MLTRTINMTILIRLHIRSRGNSKKTSVIEKTLIAYILLWLSSPNDIRFRLLPCIAYNKASVIENLWTFSDIL